MLGIELRSSPEKGGWAAAAAEAAVGRCLWVLYKDCIYDAVINYETIFINFHLLDKRASKGDSENVCVCVSVVVGDFFSLF